MSVLDRRQPRPSSGQAPFVLSALVRGHVMSFFSHQPSPLTHKYCILSPQLEIGILQLEKLGRSDLLCLKPSKKVCKSQKNKQQRPDANKLIGSAVGTTNPPGDTSIELLCSRCPDLTIHTEQPSRVLQGPIRRSNQFSKLNSSGGGDSELFNHCCLFWSSEKQILQNISNLHTVKCSDQPPGFHPAVLYV